MHKKIQIKVKIHRLIKDLSLILLKKMIIKNFHYYLVKVFMIWWGKVLIYFLVMIMKTIKMIL